MAKDETSSQDEHPTEAPTENLENGRTTLGEIGPYRLLAANRRRRMGVVFVAEQTEPVRRTVALKVIKPGMDTREVVARFEAERQALALMDHPNIARVFDARRDGDGPAVLRDGAGARRAHHRVLRSRQPRHSRERLELFIDGLPRRAARASERDHSPRPQAVQRPGHPARRQPVPKVIDFGVAKATGQQLTEKTLFTR